MNSFNLHNRIIRNINDYRKCRISSKPLKHIDVNNSLSRGQKHFSNHFMRNINVEKSDICTILNSTDIPSILNFKVLLLYSHFLIYRYSKLPVY